MQELDATDLELLRLLNENGRRPYREMAETVDLSAPAVRDRISRLEEVGIIRGFTIDIDRSQLDDGLPLLVEIVPLTNRVDAVREAITDHEAVEHVYVTAAGHIVVHLRLSDGDPRGFLEGTVDTDDIRSYDVSLLENAEWKPNLVGTAFALDCAECGNTVTSEGESARLDGTLYHFCCASCEDRFTRQYDNLQEAVEH